jgi:H+/gluconate symporter-like permease
VTVGSVALEFSAILHRMAPSLPIILATPAVQDLGAPVLAASGIFDVVRHPLNSAELSSTLSRCVSAAAVSYSRSDRVTLGRAPVG